MANKILERELTHRVIELTIKGKEMILSGKETVIRGRMKMKAEFSEKIIGKNTKEIILSEILGGPITIRELRGKKTKEEQRAIDLLTKWHKNAEKRKDFGGIFPEQRMKINPR